MREILEAQEAVREYSVQQSRLCSALFEKYGPANDRFLTSIPSAGLVMLEGHAWEFEKHGLGVLFRELSSGVVFDAHQHLQTCPRCFDTWRLAQYFESRGVSALNVGSSVFEAQDENSLSDMLSELSRLRTIVPLEGSKSYTFAG